MRDADADTFDGLIAVHPELLRTDLLGPREGVKERHATRESAAKANLLHEQAHRPGGLSAGTQLLIAGALFDAVLAAGLDRPRRRAATR